MDFYSAAGICATTKGTIFRREAWMNEESKFFKRYLRFNREGDISFEDFRSFDLEKNQEDYLAKDWSIWQIGKR